MPLLLIAALGLLLYKSAMKLTNISFAPVGFKLSSQILQLKITNPSDTTATVNSVSGSIYAGLIKIGTYSIPNKFTIPAFNSIVLDVKLNLDPVEVINQVVTVIQNKKTPQISISGSIGTSLGSINFNNTIVQTLDITSYAQK